MVNQKLYFSRLILAGLLSTGLVTACSGKGFRPQLPKSKLNKLAGAAGAEKSGDAQDVNGVNTELRTSDIEALKEIQVTYQELITQEQIAGVRLQDLEAASEKLNLSAAEVILGLSVSKLAVAAEGSVGLHLKTLINIGDQSATSVFFDGQAAFEKDGKSTPVKMELVFDNSDKKLKESGRVSAFVACKGENCSRLLVLINVRNAEDKNILAGYRFKQVEDKFIYEGGSVGAAFKSFEVMETAVLTNEAKTTAAEKKDEPLQATQVGGGQVSTAAEDKKDEIIPRVTVVGQKSNEAAQEEEKAAQEKAAQEKAAQEKAAQEKAAQEKAAQEKAAQEKAAQEKAKPNNQVDKKTSEEIKVAVKKVADERAAKEAASNKKAKTEEAKPSTMDKVKAAISDRASDISQYFSDFFHGAP